MKITRDPLNYYLITWKDNTKKEVVRGITFDRALIDEGYGPRSKELIEKYEQLIATEQETKDFIKTYNGIESTLIWENLTEDSKLSWQARATEFKCRNSRTMPSKFPKIQ